MTTAATATATAAPAHLEPSELGTKSYWDAAYHTERRNFAANPSDQGTVWFSDVGAEEQMLSHLQALADEGVLHKSDGERGAEKEKEEEEDEEEEEGSGDAAGQNPTTATRATSFLDLGTGNGHLLFALRQEEWLGEMVGVDYSPQSILLASSIRDEECGSTASDIAFYEWDVVAAQVAADSRLADGFDVVMDKGTFDAISLSHHTDAQGRRICETYGQRIEPLVKKGGRFLITSCNWTEQELRQWFDQGPLRLEGKVPYPSFTFGGKTGSSVVTLCFVKR